MSSDAPESKIRNIFVIGTPQEFLEQLSEKFQDKSSLFFITKFHYGDWDDLYDFLDTEVVSFIITDFSASKLNSRLMSSLKHIIHLKKSHIHRSIPIIALFEDKEILHNHLVLYQSGINYFHIIGDDFNLFFGNIYYLIYEDESFSMKLARALRLQINFKFNHLLYIRSLNSFQMNVESDINLEESFQARVSKSFDGKKLEFEVSEQNPSSEIVPSLFSYDIDYVFSQGWDSEVEGNESILEDDFNSWYSLLESDKVLTKNELLVVEFYSLRPAWAFKMITNCDLQDFEYRFFNDFSESEVMGYKEPNFIVYEVLCDEDLDNLDILLNYYSNNVFKPVILIKNHPSKTAALQKMYAYDSLMVYNNKLELTEFNQMISMVRRHTKFNFNSSNFPIIENDFHLYYELEVVITSLTENEITFKTNIEIPFFTHLHLSDNDLDVFVVVVPSYIPLSPNVDGFHYLGLINSCTEKDRQSLRKIVKSFMDHLPENWNNIGLDFDSSSHSCIANEAENIQEDGEAEMSNNHNCATTVKNIAKGSKVTRERVGNSRSKL